MCVKQKLFYYQKKIILTNKKKKNFEVCGLIRSKNGIDCLEKYPRTASNQKVPEAKVSLNAKKTLSPESQVAN